jgi:hypothetical protein
MQTRVNVAKYVEHCMMCRLLPVARQVCAPLIGLLTVPLCVPAVSATNAPVVPVLDRERLQVKADSAPHLNRSSEEKGAFVFRMGSLLRIMSHISLSTVRRLLPDPLPGR